MSLVLSIDQSTSATKAIVFDPEGRVLAKAQREHQQLYPTQTRVEHDAREIWRNVLSVVRELASARRLDGLECVSITNQRETVVAFDRKSGEPLHNAITWQCRRGALLCERLREKGYEPQIREKTGLKLEPYFSASKLAWLVKNEPDLTRDLKKGSAVLGTIDAYLIHRLTGGSVFATDLTNASRTMLFDVRKARWDHELCDLFDVPHQALPEVRESSANFGETDFEGLLPRQVPIVGVMGDSQASFFAQRCFSLGDTKATFGTGTSVLMNIGREFKLNEDALTALAFTWRGQITYAFEGLINFSAATMAWLKNQLGMIRDEAEIEPLARSVADSGGVYLIPAFAGLSSPYWAPNARAAILGMTSATQREHIVRAALESIAYQLRDVLDSMKTKSGASVKQMHCDGGPTGNGLLMQFTADITRATLHVSDVANCSAWGAAMSGLLGLGFYRSLYALARLPRQTITFGPEMPPNESAWHYRGWLDAAKRIL